MLVILIVIGCYCNSWARFTGKGRILLLFLTLWIFSTSYCFLYRFFEYTKRFYASSFDNIWHGFVVPDPQFATFHLQNISKSSRPPSSNSSMSWPTSITAPAFGVSWVMRPTPQTPVVVVAWHGHIDNGRSWSCDKTGLAEWFVDLPQLLHIWRKRC